MLRRWYWKVGFVVLAVPLCGATVFLAALADWPPGMAGGIANWGHGLTFGAQTAMLLSPASVLWFFWLCPWLAANDRHATWARHPQQYARGLPAIVWFPVGACWLSATAFAVLNVSDRLTNGQWAWEEDAWWLACSLIAGVLLLPWTWWLSRQVQRRFRATMALRGTCWRCGYDLRGNPAATACPECGEGVLRGADASGDK